jgi:hypothetical protein
MRDLLPPIDEARMSLVGTCTELGVPVEPGQSNEDLAATITFQIDAILLCIDQNLPCIPLIQQHIEDIREILEDRLDAALEALNPIEWN